MRTTHTARGVPFIDLSVGSAFRFSVHRHPTIGLKVNFFGHAPAGLVLTSGNPRAIALRTFDPGEMDHQEVAELLNVEIEPSEDAVVSPVGHIAEVGEIELCGDTLLLVIKAPAGGGHVRVDLSNGEVGHSKGRTPSQVYTEWRLMRTAEDGRRETIYHHQPVGKGEPRIRSI